MTTCAQAIKEVFTSKDQIITTKQIIDAVEKKYPSQWKEITIRTHTMGSSVNHTSNKHYPSFPKFLHTEALGKARLYDPDRDSEFIGDKTDPTDPDDDLKVKFDFEAL